MKSLMNSAPPISIELRAKAIRLATSHNKEVCSGKEVTALQIANHFCVK